MSFRQNARAGIYEEISPDPIMAEPEEAQANPRSRSAKLRWARRTDENTKSTKNDEEHDVNGHK